MNALVAFLKTNVPAADEATPEVCAPVVSKLVPVAAPMFGVTKVGEVENTKFVEVVPVAPAALYPVILLKAVMLADVAPVPPLATGKAVPLKVTANVPDEVIGLPETDKKEGTVIATLVTVPEFPLTQLVFVPSLCKNLFIVPAP